MVVPGSDKAATQRGDEVAQAQAATAPAARAEVQRSTTLSEYQDAVELVRASNPDGSGFHVSNIQKSAVNGADILWVAFDEPGRGGVFNYVLKRGKNLDLFRNDNSLINGLIRASSRQSIFSVMFNTQVITGIIALTFISAIIFLVIRDPDNVRIPEILSSGFALILGFYFGRSSGSRDV